MFQLHYKPKKISKIEMSDKRVAIIGKVHSVSGLGGLNKPSNSFDSFILEDETGKIEIFISGENNESRIKEKSKIKKGRLLRVFCTIDGDRLNADVVQTLEGLDLNLLKAVDDLYMKAGV